MEVGPTTPQLIQRASPICVPVHTGLPSCRPPTRTRPRRRLQSPPDPAPRRRVAPIHHLPLPHEPANRVFASKYVHLPEQVAASRAAPPAPRPRHAFMETPLTAIVIDGDHVAVVAQLPDTPPGKQGYAVPTPTSSDGTLNVGGGGTRDVIDGQSTKSRHPRCVVLPGGSQLAPPAPTYLFELSNGIPEAIVVLC